MFIPLTYQGSAQTFIDRMVMASQRGTRRPETTKPEPRLPAAPQLATITEIGAAEMPKPEPPPPPSRETLEALAEFSAATAEQVRFDPVPEPTAPPAAEPLAADSAQPASEAPPPADEAAAKPAEPPEPKAPPTDDDAPGALMDVLSRAQAEAAEAEGKHKPS
jgi:hypothetical protein